MIDIAFIRKNPKEAKAIMKRRGCHVNIDSVLDADKERIAAIQKLEVIRADQNKISRDIAGLSGDARDKAVSASKKLKEKIGEKEEVLRRLEEKFKELIYQLPNLLIDGVPDGKDANDNRVLRQHGKPPKFDFEPKDHVELGRILDGIDIERAAKVSGSRFGYFKGGVAMMQFAMLQFVFSELTNVKVIKKIADSVEKNYCPKPFIPVVPPVMIRPEPYIRMARLSPKDKDERYHIPKDDIYLIGSSEHTLGSLHMDETIPENEFPIRYLGYSTCFRREAGSYGQDTRGMLRVHQFDKIEMESFTLPESSVREQDFFVAVQEYLIRKLKVPYRVVLMCTGDMGDPDARQIDIECWMAGQGRYRETHTSDLMTDYQTRRLNTRAKRADKKTEFVHTNDATAIAMGRMLIAILENNQNKDGSVNVPSVLQPYMGGVKKLEPKSSI